MAALRERARAMARRAAATGLAFVDRARTGASFNPFSRGFIEDPYPAYARLTARDPLHKMLGGPWIASGYELCEGMLRDPRFSADERNNPQFRSMRARRVAKGILTEEEAQRAPSMLRMDPPEHDRLRRLVNTAFTPRRTAQMRGWLEGITADLLAKLDSRGEMDLIAGLAHPLPVHAIGQLIGVPEADRTKLKRWSEALIATLGPTTDDQIRESMKAGRAFRAYLIDLCERRRRAPEDDLMSALALVEEASDRLRAEEIYTVCALLLVAGHETTTNLIGNGALALAAHPEQLGLLQERPELVAGAIEEMLRYDPPVQATSRIATEDIDLAGRRIARGQEVVVLLAAANRDPGVFDDPHAFDIQRKGPRHLSFGFGTHFCLGASLARLEAEVAFRALLARGPRLELAGRPRRRDNFILRGFESLPVRIH